MNWGKPKEVIKYVVVECKPTGTLPAMTPELSQSIASLAGHPGFQYLSMKLQKQGELLAASLTNDRHNDLREAEFLQSGVQWCSWLQRQVDAATNRVRTPRPATPEEVSAFGSLELVGEEALQG